MVKIFTQRRKFCGMIVAVVCLLLPGVVLAQIGMGSFAKTYTQDFNTLPSTGTQAELGVNAFIPDGWSIERSKSGSTIYINNGSSNTGVLYSYGNNSSTDRALGAIAAEKTGIFTYNLLLQNTSGKAITALDIAYVGEQWRCGSINTDRQSLLFTYAIAEYPSSFNLSTNINTPGWTQVPSMRFESPVIKRTAGHVNGNQVENRKQFAYTLPEVIPAGYYVMLRWVDPDELEQDHGLAIDDVQVNWHFEEEYVPLPVELTRFAANVTGQAVKLTWTTASEQNSRHFEVERSIDGKNFKGIGMVAAQGTTNLTTNYTYADEQPLAGTVYYRLRQVDADMSFAYSKVVAARVEKAATASVYPTITSALLKVELPHSQGAYQLLVYDNMGRSLLVQQLSGSYVHTLDVSHMGYGNYILVLLDEQGQKQVLRFQKN
jgi:hypothetical protein